MSTGAQNGPVASARGRARRLAFRATTADCPVKGVAANDVPITRNDHEAGSRITEKKKKRKKSKSDMAALILRPSGAQGVGTKGKKL